MCVTLTLFLFLHLLKYSLVKVFIRKVARMINYLLAPFGGDATPDAAAAAVASFSARNLRNRARWVMEMMTALIFLLEVLLLLVLLPWLEAVVGVRGGGPVSSPSSPSVSVSADLRRPSISMFTWTSHQGSRV